MIFFSIFSAIIVFSLQYISFGLWILNKTRLVLSSLEKILISIFLSIAINTSVFFLFGHLIGASVYFFSLIPLAIGLLNSKNLFSLVKDVWQKATQCKFLSILAFLALLSFYATIAFSWIKIDGNLIIQSGQLHDSAWHIALINQLVKAIPPEHPSDFSLTVTNYHYFYDLMIAGMSKVFNLEVSHLYFQFFPLVLSSLLAGSALALGKRLGGKITAGYLLFLTFFAGSFAYFIPWFFPVHSWHDSSFWVSQTFGMMINPQIILSLALMMMVLLLIHLSLSLEKKQKKISLEECGVQFILILLITASIGIKSYSFVVLSLMYGVYLSIKLINQRSFWPVVFGGALAIFALPFLWLITGLNTSSFIYKPLWFISSMVEAPDRLNHLEWKFLEDHYRHKNAWYRLWELKAKQVLIFFLGNLGVRFTALGIIPLLLFKKVNSNRVYLVILAGFLFSTIFPLFFLQRGMVWNSIQFWYYGLILANIFGALVLSYLHQKISNKILLSAFILTVVGLAIPSVISVAKIKYLSSETVSSAELAMLEKISKDDTVIVDPGTARYFDTSLVSALTQAKMVYVNPVQLILLGINVEEKESEILDLIEHKPHELKIMYPGAKVISKNNWQKETGRLVDQVDEKLFLYQL